MATRGDVNQWLAIIDGEIAGQGTTASAALDAARIRFPDRSPKLHYNEVEEGAPLPLSPLLGELRPLVDNLEIPVYLVGGAVRDAVLDRTSHDIDLAVPSGAIALTYRIANALHVPAYPLDSERDVGRIILPDWQTTIDIARFRGLDLADDLAGRDFTMNALALPATARNASSIIDLADGREDIAKGRVRVIQPDSVTDDPVRALRAIRQALQFGFELTAETVDAVKAAALLLPQVSPERIRDELINLLVGEQPDLAVALVAQYGLLTSVLPEVALLHGVAQSSPHHEPVLEHTISVLRWLVQVEKQIDPDSKVSDPTLEAISTLLEPYRAQLQTHLNRPVEGGLDGLALLRLGGLFHDTGKRDTQTIDADGRIRFLGHDGVGAALASRRMKALAFSNEAAAHVARITDGHMRPLHLAGSDDRPTRRAAYRFYRSAHDAGVDIILLSLADHLATFDGAGDVEAWTRLLGVAEALLDSYFTAYDVVVKPTRLLTGSDLISELSVEPGPEVGRLLREIEEAQASGTISTREEALSLAQQLHQA